MTKSLLHDRKKIQKMSVEQKKKFFAGKGPGHLRWMEHRHGYGMGSKEYEQHHDLKTLYSCNPYKIVEEVISELSQEVLHRYTMKAIKNSKDTEDNYVKSITAGKEPTGGFGHAIRKIMNRASGVARAQRRIGRDVKNEDTIMDVLSEIVSDGASNWGGWQGGMPGSGSPLKGMKGGGKDDVGKIQKKQDVQKPAKSPPEDTKDDIKLSGKKTKVIVSPTLQQSANKIDTKNATVAPTDMPPKSGKSQTVKQVKEEDNATLTGKVRPNSDLTSGYGRRLKQAWHNKKINQSVRIREDDELHELSDKVLQRYKWKASMQMAAHHDPDSAKLTGKKYGNRVKGYWKTRRKLKEDKLAGLLFKAGAHLGKSIFGGKKKKEKPEVKANPDRNTFKAKPPTVAQQKKADLDASTTHFNAWKKQKADMHAVFKKANDMGLDHDINTPYKSFKQRQDSKARLANPLKQPNETPPASPPSTEKPRVRVKAISRPAAPPPAPKPEPVKLKPRMSAGEFKNYLKQTKLDPGKHIKLGGGTSD